MAETFIVADEFDPPATAEASPLNVASEFEAPRATLSVAEEFEPPPARERAAIVEDAQWKVNAWKSATTLDERYALVKIWAGEQAAKVFKQNASEVWEQSNKPLLSVPRLNTPSMDQTPESMRPMQKTASVLAGAYNAVAGFTESMATPFNIGTLGTFGALTKAAQGTGRAAKSAEVALAALKVGFGAEMAKAGGEQAGKASVDLANPDVPLQEKVETALAPLITGGLAILSAHSGAKDAIKISDRPASGGGQTETILSTPEPKPSADAVQPPRTAIDVIADVARMGPDEFLQWEQQNGGQTGASNRIGIELIDNPDGITALKKAGEAVKAEWRAAFEEVKAAGPGENVAGENKMQKLASKEQFFSEAVSAAEGTGSGLQDPAVVAAHEARSVTSEFIPPEGISPDGPLVGLGAASPKEFIPVEKFETSLKQEVRDAERVARGEPPIEKELSKTLGDSWEEGRKIVDENQNAADDLIATLKEKGKAIDDTEVAVLLQRKVDLKNQYNRADKNVSENIGTPDSLAADERAKVRLLDELNELDAAIAKGVTKTARGLNALKLAAAEDFSVASMMSKRRTAKGGAKLTPEEEVQVKEQHAAIEEAQRALDQHEAQLELDAAIATPEAAAEQIAKLEAEIEAAPKGKSGSDLKKETRKRIEDLKKRVESGDFSKKEVVLDEQGRRLQAKAEKAKADFNDTLARDKYAQLSGARKLLSNAADSWDLARNLFTSGEFSQVLRQGLLTTASRPVTTAKALPKAVRALFADEITSRAIDLETLNSPEAKVARDAGVHIDEPGQRLSQREESIASEWAKKIPGLRNFNQFGRVFLNKVRVDNFNAMKNVRPDLTGDDLKLIAKYVNQATGRGSLGKFGEKNAAELNRVLFSARYQASRLQYLTGNSLWGGNGRTTAVIGREYARTLLGLTAMYGLYEFGMSDEEGYKPLSFDSRGTDFGKMHFGKATIDPLAGLSQWIVFASRTGLTLADSLPGVEIEGQSLTRNGDLVSLRGRGGRDIGDVVATFGRSKLHPLLGASWSAYKGRDIIGDPTSWGEEALKLTHPMTYEDIMRAFKQMDVDDATAVSALAMLGMGLNVQREKEEKQMGVARPADDTKKQVTLPSGKKVNVRPAK